MIVQQMCNHCKIILDEYDSDTYDCANKIHYCESCKLIQDDFGGRLCTEQEKLELLIRSLSKDEKLVLGCFV